MVQAPIPDIELGAELGRGAHSFVLRGTRDGQDYAVKLPLDAGTDIQKETAYRRFLREAAALARVSHSSLPAVMEVGRTRGIPYLIMELASGETLADRLKRKTLTEAEAIAVGVQLAGALAAIHGVGLLHGDVKPRNVVLDPRTGAARLVDLGSAVAAPGIGRHGITRAYAAPEMLHDGLGTVDARADLYSLGLVLIEALGGQGRGSLPEGISNGLSALLQRATHEAPEGRWRSATALVDALSRLSGPFTASNAVPVSGVVSRGSRLLGRRTELDRLRRAWADANRGARVVFLTGAPGLGKSRLARAFLDDSAAAGVRILTAACHPRDPRPFSAARQLVEAHLRSIDDLPATERARAHAELRRLAGDFGSLLKLLSPAVARIFRDQPTMPASENAEQAFAEGLGEFLMKLLKVAAPAVVFVDDLQWLDTGSRRVLARAASQAAAARVLFLFGVRQSEGVETRRLLDVGGTPSIDLDLALLRDDDVIELVRDYLAARELDGELKHAVLGLSDGTPLRSLEVVRLLVDEGVILPHWGRWRLDTEALSRTHLPRETTSLLQRRIESLDAFTQSVLAVAAVIGMTFEEDLLRAAASADLDGLAAVIAEGRAAQLIEPVNERTYRFLHHTVREALLARREVAAVEGMHQRVAEELDRASAYVDPARVSFEIEGAGEGSRASDPGAAGDLDREGQDADRLYRIAHHYASGVPGRTPMRVAETCIAAGHAAFARFDNHRAAELFTYAERALALIGSHLTPEHRMLLAEARLRLGSLEEAFTEFGRVLDDSADPDLQANALARLASVHDMRLDSVQAWACIEEAFRKLGETPPVEELGYTAASVSLWASRGLANRRRAPLDAAGRLRCETLCALYYQAMRIAVTHAKPGRAILATIRAVTVAERLGPSAPLAKSYLAYGFVLTLTGMPKKGAQYLERAEEMARELRDPFMYSHALQLHLVIAAWAGRIQDSVDAASRCILEYGHWRELSEFCVNCYTLYQMETVRGRDLEAWKWLEVGMQRVSRHDGTPIVHEFLLLAARASLTTLGREDDIPSRLFRLQQVTVAVPKDSGMYASTFSPLIALLAAKMDMGPEFEALVSEFRSLGQDPKRVHLNVTEYYIQVAHARVHACLRARPEGRGRLITELRSALTELEAAAKIPLIVAHARAIAGYVEWLHDRKEAASAAFDEAQRLAVAETAPWVLYAVYRGRAHMLRTEGKLAAARDQAVLAESVAMEHGSVYKARFVREEFGLRPRWAQESGYLTSSFATSEAPLFVAEDPSPTTTQGGSRARRQLRALLRISQARVQELAPDHQARLVVDELVQALRSNRGYLFLAPEVMRAAGVDAKMPAVQALEFVVGRDASGRELGDADDYDRTVIRDALVATASDEERASMRCRIGTTARLAAIAAPLVVDDVTAGVIYLDRPLAEGVFSEIDGEILAALAGQVSVALELTRSLRAREQAQESLRNAEKMDAVARLARGIAHDINNMLSAIRLATVAMLAVPGADELVGEDVNTIQSALQRANELTRQLGVFSRGELIKPQLVRMGHRIERLVPVIVGLVGESIRFETRIPARLPAVLVDPDQLDQIVMNLVVNARDAMPGGGHIVVTAAEVTLDEAYVRERPRVSPGRYVRLAFSDTGHGMDEEVRKKVFEPYFTTKQERGGTGLGLATVYWVVSQSGGHVEVESVVGEGTTFTVLLPCADQGAPSSARSRLSRRAGRHTILLVEEDAIVARQLEQTLAVLGYRVLAASSGGQALELTHQRDDEIDLVITDVVMQGMNGLELARELRRKRPDLAVLFLLGDTGGVVAERGILGEGEDVELLPKPVEEALLERRVREVLARRRKRGSD